MYPIRKMRPRVIAVLLLRDGQLYKTVRFGKPKYVGDPRVAVKILNDKGCDELVLLDILATPQGREPDFRLLEEIASESFMPVAYGGGVSSVERARTVISLGVEKVVLNTAAIDDPALIGRVAELAGSSSTMVSMDVARNWLGQNRVVTACGRRRTGYAPVEWARKAESLGAGEILVCSIDRDGMMAGYDLALVRDVAAAVNVPVVALGGAGTEQHLRDAIDAGAAAAAAGSLFVFQGPHRAVLITYPDDSRLNALM